MFDIVCWLVAVWYTSKNIAITKKFIQVWINLKINKLKVSNFTCSFCQKNLRVFSSTSKPGGKLN